MMVDRAAACGGKEALSWTEADRRARGLRRKTGKHVTPFHCRCGFAHIGNSMGGNVSRRRKRDRLEKIIKRERWTA